MARYYLDTNVLEGLTFLHDAWRDEAERLFDTENSLFIGQGVLWEYCNNDGERLENTAVDWDAEAGRFGAKLSAVRLSWPILDAKLESYNDEELDIHTLVDEFLDVSGVHDEEPGKGTDEELIEGYIRPRIKAFLEEVIDGREINSAVASEAMRDLCYTIQEEAREKRVEIKDRVTEKRVEKQFRKQYFDNLSYVSGYIDTFILGGVAYLANNNFLHRIVSSDNSHMYSNRERLRADHGIVVVFIKDEFAKPPKLN